LQDAAL
jgi:hypothetical protein